ncbi:hypothetical protein B0H63DRAFT_486726 [Podospora didyma]|uniref:Uncharacterized protein n=1 Tax=Podospora didyma TaxID=330526 RepID=A0AAE0N4U3_9PEZI|nr:hypothetical protein B0H63DRAFT_486726 [Podospora didyma]
MSPSPPQHFTTYSFALSLSRARTRIWGGPKDRNAELVTRANPFMLALCALCVFLSHSSSRIYANAACLIMNLTPCTFTLTNPTLLTSYLLSAYSFSFLSALFPLSCFFSMRVIITQWGGIFLGL